MSASVSDFVYIKYSITIYLKYTSNHMAKKGGNPQNFNNPPKSTLTPLNVRLTDEEIDKFVRSLPNRTEWLRKAIALQV